MPDFYDKDKVYTQDVVQLDKDIRAALRPVINYWAGKGFNLHQMERLIQKSVLAQFFELQLNSTGKKETV